MKELTVSVREEEFERLQGLATDLGVSLEELARVGLQDLLAQPDEALQQATKRVLEKNRELYRRLA